MSYICELCKKLILPTISYEKKSIAFSIESCEIVGGCGNKVIYRHICPECRKILSLKNNFIR